VGRLSDVVPARDREDGRFVLRFSEYARVEVPNAWRPQRLPFRYGTLEEVGIDPETLDWMPMPAPAEVAPEEAVETTDADSMEQLLDFARHNPGRLVIFVGFMPEAVR
jgi:hypothetical protein